MKHFFSTSNFYLRKNPDQILTWAAEKKFDGIEIFADVPGFYVDNFSDKILKKYASKSPSLMYNIHSPIYGINIAAVNPGILAESLRQILKIMEWARIIKIENFVIHLGTLPAREKEVEEKSLKILNRSITKILSAASKYKIRVIAENIGLSENYMDYDLNSLKTISKKYKMGICFDAGHGNISGNTDRILTEFRDSIKSVHVSDNYEKADEHNPVGEGTIQWTNIVKLILKNNLPVVHEIHNRQTPGPSTLKSRKNLERILESVSRETI